MARRHVALASLAVIVGLSLGVAGCGSTIGDNADQAGTAGAAQALEAAAAKTSGQSFAYTVQYGKTIAGSGKQDATGENAVINMDLANSGTGVTVKTKVRVVGADAYIKVDFGSSAGSVPSLGQVGDRWMHLDSAKLGGAGPLGISPGRDLVSGGALLGAVTEVRKIGDTGFAGTIDLGKTTLPFAGAGVAAVGSTAAFTAALDDAGRLARVAVELPTSEVGTGGTLEINYSDYGVAVEVVEPAKGDTVEAPALLYQFLQFLQ